MKGAEGGRRGLIDREMIRQVRRNVAPFMLEAFCRFYVKEIIGP
jgi:hypothetical protein